MDRVERDSVRPNFVNNGAMVLGYVPFTPNIRSQTNAVAAFFKRPAMYHPFRPDIREMYRVWIVNVYIPNRLTYCRPYQRKDQIEYIMTLDVSLPMKRKMIDYVWKVRQQGGIVNNKDKVIELFIKNEFYDVPDKFPRLIMPKTAKCRAWFGACIHGLVETMMYFPTSIKAVPVYLRAQYIREKLGHLGEVVEFDLSSQESSCDPWMIENVLRPCYLAFSGGKDNDMINNFLDIKAAHQKYRYGSMRFESQGMNNSGDVDTGYCNFVQNDAASSFCKYLETQEMFTGTIEGDDGTGEVVPNMQEIYTALGYTMKLELKSTLADASFCRISCGGTNNLTDALYALCKLGWSSAQYLWASQEKLYGLLRAKCMSYICQFAGCPIIFPVCVAIYCALEGITPIRPTDWWEQEKLKCWKPELLAFQVLDGDRVEYARKFGIPVSYQHSIERELIDDIRRSGKELQCLYSPSLIALLEIVKPSFGRNFEDKVAMVYDEQQLRETNLFRSLDNILNNDFRELIHTTH